MTRFHRRPGFTLIEMLVVLAMITALAGLTVLIAPAALNSDRTLSGTSQVQTSLGIAQGMASDASTPRGVRLIAPADGSLLITELQYIEQPAVIVPNPRPLSSGNPLAEPHVRFDYAYAPGPMPARGTIVSRRVVFQNLTTDEAYRLRDGGTLVLPTLGFWSKFKPNANRAINPQSAPYDTTKFAVVLDPPPSGYPFPSELDVYPDVSLGAAGATADGNLHPVYQTFHFGVYSAAVPLFGERTIPLPQDICVDLNVSLPSGTPGQDYDILFAPSGQLVDNPNGQIFLWVRDMTKVPDMLPSTVTPLTYDPDKFRKGGEQQIVAIRGRSAMIGAASVAWPDMSTGQYPPIAGQPYQDPFTFARKKLN